jgi:hypothetical protein
MSLGLLTLEIYIPGCQSLKEKRGRLKPLIAKLHREFNVSVAEIDYQDRWNETILACALVSNDNGYTQRALQKVVRWIEINWRVFDLIADQLEIL